MTPYKDKSEGRKLKSFTIAHYGFLISDQTSCAIHLSARLFFHISIIAKQKTSQRNVIRRCMTVPVFLSIQVTSFRLTNKNHTRFKQNSCTFNHFLHSHAVLFCFIQFFFSIPVISIHSSLILDADDKYNIFLHLFGTD